MLPYTLTEIKDLWQYCLDTVPEETRRQSRYYNTVRIAAALQYPEDSEDAGIHMHLIAREFISSEVPFLKTMFLSPIEDMPLLINDGSSIIRTIARWRLRLGR